ncbi:MAG: glycosyltransferase family 2 protein [Bradymonadaceae bacterium]|nr:glycosyltransferase family 2 protein [Lujinxingiaceae bacterium]
MFENARVAVVVPAFCEAQLLPRTLARMPDYVDWIVVVDDGSPDQTFWVASEFARHHPRVKVVRLGFNYGVGRAITEGYRWAMALGADVVAVMAADDQMDPADLPGVLRPVTAGFADYSKGNRLIHHEARAMPPVRRAGTRLLARLTGYVAGIADLDDAQCGYTAISSAMLHKLPLDDIYPRYGYPNDMLLRLAERGARIVQPVVRPIYADEISGLSVPRVIVPISSILMRGAMRRAVGRRI